MGIFTKEDLKEFRASLNELIASRVVYLQSKNISQAEYSYTSNKLTEDYKLLEKVIELISKEENK
jgi:hypothetical protein